MSVLIWIGLLLVGVWALILLIDQLIDLESHNVDLGPGILTWRTKHGLGILDKISSTCSSGWKAFGLFSAVSGTVLMVFMLLNLVLGGYHILTFSGGVGGASEGVYPVVPGVTIPFAAGLIGLATVLLVHEPAHGIVLRRLGLKTKSTGLLLFLIIPGAFVEEDEEEFKNAPVSERLQIAGSGPLANVLFSLLCLGLVLALVNPMPGIYITSTVENKPATEVGLKPGARLSSIDNTQISNYQEFIDFMDNTQAGQEVTVHTILYHSSDTSDYTENQYQVVLENMSGENKGYLGVYATQSFSRSTFLHPLTMIVVMMNEIRGYPLINHYSYSAGVPWFFIVVLKWMFVLNLGVGLFNLLPLGPLDGGHISTGIFEKFTSRSKAQIAMRVLSAITLFFLLLNILPALM